MHESHVHRSAEAMRERCTCIFMCNDMCISQCGGRARAAAVALQLTMRRAAWHDRCGARRASHRRQRAACTAVAAHAPTGMQRHATHALPRAHLGAARCAAVARHSPRSSVIISACCARRAPGAGRGVAVAAPPYTGAPTAACPGAVLRAVGPREVLIFFHAFFFHARTRPRRPDCTTRLQKGQRCVFTGSSVSSCAPLSPFTPEPYGPWASARRPSPATRPGTHSTWRARSTACASCSTGARRPPPRRPRP